MTTEDLINIGFEAIPHYTITDSHVYKLGRRRHLSIGNVGTPNEMMWICETSDQDEKFITDLICLHNYDYDGYLTKEKIIGIINLITK